MAEGPVARITYVDESYDGFKKKLQAVQELRLLFNVEHQDDHEWVLELLIPLPGLPGGQSTDAVGQELVDGQDFDMDDRRIIGLSARRG